MNGNVVEAQIDTLRVWEDEWRRESLFSGRQDDAAVASALGAAVRQMERRAGVTRGRATTAEPSEPAVVEEARAG